MKHQVLLDFIKANPDKVVKIRVSSITSREIQESCFTTGIKWALTGKKISNTSQPCLYVSDRKIQYSDDDGDFFDNHNGVEYFAELESFTKKLNKWESLW